MFIVKFNNVNIGISNAEFLILPSKFVDIINSDSSFRVSGAKQFEFIVNYQIIDLRPIHLQAFFRAFHRELDRFQFS